MIQISFKNARIKKLQDSHNPESALKFTADPRSTVFSKSANPLDLPLKLIHYPCAFYKAKRPLIRKPIHPLLYHPQMLKQMLKDPWNQSQYRTIIVPSVISFLFLRVLYRNKPLLPNG